MTSYYIVFVDTFISLRTEIMLFYHGCSVGGTRGICRNIHVNIFRFSMCHFIILQYKHKYNHK